MANPDSSKISKRSSADSEESSRKKMKKGGGDETYNPYLAHMYDGDANGDSLEPAPNSPFAGMKRRQTTAAQASKAEDSETCPFTGRSHSQQYFQILQTRRDLPVSKQRYVLLFFHFLFNCFG